MKTLKYNGYFGSVDFDLERGVLRGKVLFVTDLVTYEAKTVPELEQEFALAVDDYIETCKAVGKEPEKAFTGQFNLRCDAEDHKELAVIAAESERTLNAVTCEAIKFYLSERSGATRKVEHHHTIQVVMEEEKGVGIASPSQPLQWETHGGNVH